MSNADVKVIKTMREVDRLDHVIVQLDKKQHPGRIIQGAFCAGFSLRLDNADDEENCCNCAYYGYGEAKCSRDSYVEDVMRAEERYKESRAFVAPGFARDVDSNRKHLINELLHWRIRFANRTRDSSMQLKRIYGIRADRYLEQDFTLLRRKLKCSSDV